MAKKELSPRRVAIEGFRLTDEYVAICKEEGSHANRAMSELIGAECLIHFIEHGRLLDIRRRGTDEEILMGLLNFAQVRNVLRTLLFSSLPCCSHLITISILWIETTTFDRFSGDLWRRENDSQGKGS